MTYRSTPEEQQEYRANRDMVTAHQAFEDMKDDADQRRSFSNLVLEYLTDYEADHPLKMIGGQHRYTAIKEVERALIAILELLNVLYPDIYRVKGDPGYNRGLDKSMTL